MRANTLLLPQVQVIGLQPMVSKRSVVFTPLASALFKSHSRLGHIRHLFGIQTKSKINENDESISSNIKKNY